METIFSCCGHAEGLCRRFARHGRGAGDRSARRGRSAALTVRSSPRSTRTAQITLRRPRGGTCPLRTASRGRPAGSSTPTLPPRSEGKHAVVLEKPTFGSLELVERIRQAAGGADFSVELIGLCTDICVVSNALLLKANFYEQTVRVDAACCAGVTPETHRAALTTMRMCQIEVENA